MEKTISQALMAQPNFGKIRQSVTAIGQLATSAIEFVYNGIFSAQVKKQIEPGVTENVRNEGFDQARPLVGRHLI